MGVGGLCGHSSGDEGFVRGVFPTGFGRQDSFGLLTLDDSPALRACMYDNVWATRRTSGLCGSGRIPEKPGRHFEPHPHTAFGDFSTPPPPAARAGAGAGVGALSIWPPTTYLHLPLPTYLITPTLCSPAAHPPPPLVPRALSAAHANYALDKVLQGAPGERQTRRRPPCVSAPKELSFTIIYWWGVLEGVVLMPSSLSALLSRFSCLNRMALTYVMWPVYHVWYLCSSRFFALTRCLATFHVRRCCMLTRKRQPTPFSGVISSREALLHGGTEAEEWRGKSTRHSGPPGLAALPPSLCGYCGAEWLPASKNPAKLVG